MTKWYNITWNYRWRQKNLSKKYVTPYIFNKRFNAIKHNIISDIIHGNDAELEDIYNVICNL
jgi:hypothetical protein